MAKPGYEMAEIKSDSNIKFFFISKGVQEVVKLIDYSFVGSMKEKKIFNLAFGDYNIESNYLDDHHTTENGDVYDVFYTVLNSISKFFNAYPDESMMIKGSDSGEEFFEACKVDCKRGCDHICKKQGRRINIYRAYINKHYDWLSHDYVFFGGLKQKVELYKQDGNYDTVFVVRKNCKLEYYEN